LTLETASETTITAVTDSISIIFGKYFRKIIMIGKGLIKPSFYYAHDFTIKRTHIFRQFRRLGDKQIN
jgi:hypothetical protein